MNDDSLQSTSPNLCTASDCNARVTEEVEKGSNASAVIILEQLINEGYLLQASDIHINPTEEDILVKMRVDGVLQVVHSIPKSIHNELITRLKVLCGLRTDEHQAALDGRLRQICVDSVAIDIIGKSPKYLLFGFVGIQQRQSAKNFSGDEKTVWNDFSNWSDR